MNSWIIGIACILLLLAVLYEMYKGQIKEGFEGGGAAAGDFFNEYYPKRTDIIPGQVEEDGGWVRDLRYKEQYVDVQRLGFKHDFCRVTVRRGDPGSMIMACGLAGTDGTTSRGYKTRSKAEGFIFSRDDYFREVNSDNRDDYCRIVKVEAAPDDAWEARCVPAEVSGFATKEIRDNEPPKEIVDLLWFYEGLMAWYRMKDDINDYAANTMVSLAGAIKIDEDPTRDQTEGLHINETPIALIDSPPPAEQFIRIGDNKELEFERKFELRQMRAISVWVRFDMFTNNARIFDFGNGAGKDNVFLGIEGRGNDSAPGKKKPLGPAPTDDDIVCQRIASREIAPALYMKYTESNVELYDCPGPEPVDPAVKPQADEEQTEEKRANLLFEIWDKEQRKMRLKIVDAVKERTWHHIVLTTKDYAFRPTWEVYIDGIKVFTKEDGHLPQTAYVIKNYIGKSNWEDAAGQGEYKDERFRGSLFDMRFYRIPMSESKIMRTFEWGEGLIANLGREPRAAALRGIAKQSANQLNEKARTAAEQLANQRKQAKEANKKADTAASKANDLQAKLAESQKKLKEAKQKAEDAAKKALADKRKLEADKKKAEADCKIKTHKADKAAKAKGSKAPGSRGTTPKAGVAGKGGAAKGGAVGKGGKKGPKKIEGFDSDSDDG